MIQQGLKYFTDLPISLMGMMLFLIAYVGIVLRITLKNNPSETSYLSELPLKEDLK